MLKAGSLRWADSLSDDLKPPEQTRLLRGVHTECVVDGNEQFLLVDRIEKYDQMSRLQKVLTPKQISVVTQAVSKAREME